MVKETDITKMEHIRKRTGLFDLAFYSMNGEKCGRGSGRFGPELATLNEV